MELLQRKEREKRKDEAKLRNGGNMERKVGTISRGIRCPIIREGDDLAQIVVESVLDAAECEGFKLCDRDVISVTESIVARAQGNYASVQDIADDVREIGRASCRERV